MPSYIVLVLALLTLSQGQDHDIHSHGHDHGDHDIADHSDENFRITSIEIDPFYMVDDSTREKSGYVLDLLENLKDVLGDFSYVITEVRDGKFGSPGTGTDRRWTGMIGEVKEDYADFALAPLTKTNDRAAVVSFTDPFMTSTYTAVFKSDTDNIDTFEDLANSDDMKFITIRGGSTDRFIQDSHNRNLQKIAQWMTNNQNRAYVTSTKEAIRKVKEGGHAFILESPNAEYITHQEPCDLKEIDVPDSPTTEYAIAFPKNDDHVGHFNEALKKLKDDGVLSHLHHKWFHQACDSHGHGHHEDDDHDHTDHGHDKTSASSENAAASISCFLSLIAALFLLVKLI